jgi:hypothetical protein
MIKELFDIESKQKNVLLIAVCIFGLSFLQLYLFKKSIFDIGIFFTLGISLGLTVCWTILNIPSLALFHGIITHNTTGSKISSADSNFAIFILGLVALAWISALTFVSYLSNLTFKDFLLISVAVSVVRTLTWFIIRYFQYRKSKK